MQYLYFPRQNDRTLACILSLGNAEGVARIITVIENYTMTVLWNVGEHYTTVKVFGLGEIDEYNDYFRRLAKELGAKNVDLF